MSVLTSTNRVDYTADGLALTFAFSFAVYTQTDLKVYVTPAGGTATLQVLNVDYTQTAINVPGGQTGGSITFSVAPASNARVTLIRSVSVTQATSFTNLDKFDAKTAIEATYDKAVMILQQLYEMVTGRSFVLPVNVTGYGTTLPDPTIAANQGLFLQIGASGITAANPAILGITVPALTTGSIPYASGTTALAQDNTNLFWDSANKRLGLRTNTPNRTLEIVQSADGIPQIRLTGHTTGYGELRCGGSGGDDGDMFLQQTGSTIWHQSYTTNYPCTMKLVPKGTVATYPANLEVYGTDYLADATNYERIRLDAEGGAGTEHELTSEAGGTGTVRPIHIYLGGVANGIYLSDGTKNGVGTKSPRVKWDINSNANVQLRLTYTDNSVYTDISTDSSGNLIINPSGNRVKLSASTKRLHIPVVATGSLPAAAASEDGSIIIEDAGAGDRNIIIYAGGERFRIDGGAAF